VRTGRERKLAEVLDAQRLVAEDLVDLGAEPVHVSRVLQEVVEGEGEEAYAKRGHLSFNYSRIEVWILGLPAVVSWPVAWMVSRRSEHVAALAHLLLGK
jgi:23S rRNA U2552 (ribose-2'-O)-methylase RlmE/FtsJ